jgi:hypothetical protein
MSETEFNLTCSNREMSEGVRAGTIEAGAQEVCAFSVGQGVCGLQVKAEADIKLLIDEEPGDEPVIATFVRMYGDNGLRVRRCPWAHIYEGRGTPEE